MLSYSSGCLVPTARIVEVMSKVTKQSDFVLDTGVESFSEFDDDGFVIAIFQNIYECLKAVDVVLD